MKGPTPRRLKKYGAKCLGLKSYLQCPGDGRTQVRVTSLPEREHIDEPVRESLIVELYSK